MREYIFERLNLMTQRVLSNSVCQEMEAYRGSIPGLINTLELRSNYDYLLRGMLVELTGWIIRDKHEHEVVTKNMEVPATWWDMLKSDHFPGWLLRYYPAKTKTITMAYEREIRVCPHANVAWPNGKHLEFLCFEDNDLPSYATTGPLLGYTGSSEKEKGKAVITNEPLEAWRKKFTKTEGRPPNSSEEYRWQVWEDLEMDAARMSRVKSEGVPCGCGLGTDTNGDGDCVVCGPEKSRKKRADQHAMRSEVPQ